LNKSPFIIFCYPFFWLMGLVPLFWPILLWFLLQEAIFRGKFSRPSNLIYILCIFLVCSLPVPFLMGEAVESTRTAGALANVLVWIVMALILGEKNSINNRGLTNSLLFVVAAQGSFTTSAIVFKTIRDRLPFQLFDIFGSSAARFNEQNLFFQDWLGQVVFRSSGMSGNPTWAGALALGGIFLAAAVFRNKALGSKLLASLAIFGGVVNLYLSQSRAVWMGGLLALMFSYLHYLYKSKPENSMLLSITTIGVILSVFVVNFQFLANLILAVDESRAGSRTARFDIYTSTLSKLSEIPFPILGYGIKLQQEGLVANLGSHSTMLGALYKGGVVAFTILIAVFLNLLNSSLKTKSSISCLAVSFLMFWSLFEDIDAGHLAPLIFLHLFNLGQRIVVTKADSRA